MRFLLQLNIHTVTVFFSTSVDHVYTTSIDTLTDFDSNVEVTGKDTPTFSSGEAGQLVIVLQFPSGME